LASSLSPDITYSACVHAAIISLAGGPKGESGIHVRGPGPPWRGR
jgi:hypothetical protein